jgi:hypothetical protein
MRRQHLVDIVIGVLLSRGPLVEFDRLLVVDRLS